MLWLILSIAGAFFKTNLDLQNAQSLKKVFLPPPHELRYFTFGYQQAFADSLWIRWVQDIDACGKDLEDRDSLLSSNAKIISDSVVGTKETSNEEARSNLSANTKATNENDTHFLTSLNEFKKINSKIPACKKGWSYLMLDTMTELDPKMHLAYALGAPTLSILAHDPLGAEAIFEKGLKVFPNDWALFYRAGYHAQFELYQPEKAAERFNKSAELGAPDWLKSLAARLHNQSGQFELAISVLEGYKRGITDAVALQKIDQRIEDLKKRLNLRNSQ